MRRIKRRILTEPIAIVVIAVLLVAACQSLAVACPTCGEALGHQDASHNGVAKGFFYSILFMMGMPYLLLGSFCGCMYWKVRRARAARALKSDLPSAAARAPAICSAARADSAARDAASAVAASAEAREPVEV